MIHILIAHDHEIARNGLKQSLEQTPQMTAVAVAATERAVLHALSRRKFDVLVIDHSPPKASAFEILAQLRQTSHRTPVLIIATHRNDHLVVGVLKAGAAGYINSDCSISELTYAAKQVAAGGKYLSPRIAEQLAASLGSNAAIAPHERLSKREHAVLKFVAAGKPLKEIATQLLISPKTVTTYRRRVLQKMSLKTNADLTEYVLTHQLRK